LFRSGALNDEEGALIERDADPEFGSPHDTAKQSQSILGDDEDETFGDRSLVGYLDGRAGKGEIADHAIEHTPQEFDCSGFRDEVARGNASFDHLTKML